ncbi:FkbM family methyltransferase [Pedobacter sp. SD-b]|uniref:FkbM family methyltransferase n=1 Tax=Pedobacter segetis TaxID=2793069 RepID=A0ABS1BGS5_9SPHI|nr:FkbM family methyltransferase [Pedobacter segetis]MBK0382072.1 FkbM family methyltransferase [Pedobacter segetis]
MKTFLQNFLGLFGLQITRKNNAKPMPIYKNEAMAKGIERFRKHYLDINTIFDVGAAEGKWSLDALNFYPNSNYLLFEPLVERAGMLNNLCVEQSNFQFVPKAAGNAKSSIKFKVTEDLDGSGIANEAEISNDNFREVQISRLDEEVRVRNLSGPYIIKLDTHGFEIPILEGCESILSDVKLFIIECYGFNLTEDSLLFWQMCKYMDDKGFRLLDIVDIMRRSKDNAFWQCDAFFIPSNNKIFKSNRYL